METHNHVSFVANGSARETLEHQDKKEAVVVIQEALGREGDRNEHIWV